MGGRGGGKEQTRTCGYQRAKHVLGGKYKGKIII